MMASEIWSVHEIPDLNKKSDSVSSPYDVTSDAIIVIDNGSYECRAGWSVDDKPRLTFRNHSTKIRGQKGSDIYVGNDISNHETSGWMPLKTPFEKNIASHPEIQEHILDHIFTKLGFSGDRIDRSVVITEPLCNPNYYRQYMSELLFECYDVPSVLYGIDSIFSLERNLPGVESATVIALGHAVSHVVPVLDGQINFKQSKRVSYGGQNVSAYLQKLLQLKHPQLASVIGGVKSEHLTHRFCKYAVDYPAQMSSFRDDEDESFEGPQLSLEETQDGVSQEQLDCQRQQDNPSDWGKSDVIRVQLPLNSIQNSASATTTSGKMDVCYAIVQKVENVLSKRHKRRLIDTQEKLNQLLSFYKIVVNEEDDRKQMKFLEELGYLCMEEVKMDITTLRKKVDAILQGDLPPEVELCHFSDPDSWLLALRRQRENVKFKISISEEDTTKDEAMLDRLELVIYETEREFKRSSVIDVENLKPTSAIHRFYQILLATEQYRAPEVIFQPSALLGIDQAGIVETFDRVLSGFRDEERCRIAEHIFVTGGPASLPGLKERLEREIRALQPFRSEFQVHLAQQPATDAWHGAKLASIKYRDFSVSKQDYEEYGPDYIKTYRCSNVYAPSPLVVRL